MFLEDKLIYAKNCFKISTVILKYGPIIILKICFQNFSSIFINLMNTKITLVVQTNK